MEKRFEIVELSLQNYSHLAQLFYEFWPEHTTLEKEYNEAKGLLSNPKQQAYLITNGDQYVGFIQVSIRHEYVDGKTTPFVGYIEGIYIQKPYQGLGLGKKLISQGEQWALAKGCTQMGSDTDINNQKSIEFHKHLGYAEIERYVSFMKDL